MLVRTAEPVGFPVTLADLRRDVATVGSEQDLTLRNDMLAATRLIEDSLGVAFNLTTFTWSFECWPETGRVLTLPRGPFSSVTSVEYYASGGTDTQPLTTWSTTNYRTHHRGDLAGQIEMFRSQTWPALDDRQDAVVIEFIAGYGDQPSEIPEKAAKAVRMLVKHWWDHPESTGKLSDAIEWSLNGLLEGLHAGHYIGA